MPSDGMYENWGRHRFNREKLAERLIVENDQEFFDALTGVYVYRTGSTFIKSSGGKTPKKGKEPDKFQELPFSPVEWGDKYWISSGGSYGISETNDRGEYVSRNARYGERVVLLSEFEGEAVTHLDGSINSTKRYGGEVSYYAGIAFTDPEGREWVVIDEVIEVRFDEVRTIEEPTPAPKKSKAKKAAPAKAKPALLSGRQIDMFNVEPETFVQAPLF